MFGYGSPLVCNARAALLHRPTFPAAFTERVRLLHVPLKQGLHRPSMWISYAPVDKIVARKHVVFGQHHVLIGPQPGWEEPKVGGGAPSVRLRDRWLVLYHGVSGHSGADATLPRRVRYCGRVLHEVLTQRERLVVMLRCGFEGGVPESLPMIGRRLGVGRERVRQIEDTALRKLRQPAVVARLARMDRRM
jgi:hypothetical protein